MIFTRKFTLLYNCADYSLFCVDFVIKELLYCLGALMCLVEKKTEKGLLVCHLTSIKLTYFVVLEQLSV